jgi:hypothetical protein
MANSATFSVKNFEKFQHYKDRSPPWIRLYNSLLDDYEFGRLPDASKAHLLAIWLLASRYDNEIPLDPDWVARRINATTPVDLAGLQKAGFIVSDQECSNTLADCKHDAMPEESRGEAETEDHIEAGTSEPKARIEFDYSFWPRYPHKVGRPSALEAFIKARRCTPLETILAGVDRYVAAKPKHHDWLKPANFLTDERWNDDPAPAPSRQQSSKPEPAHDAIFRALAVVASEGAGGGEWAPGDDGRLLDYRP